MTGPQIANKEVSEDSFVVGILVGKDRRSEMKLRRSGVFDEAYGVWIQL